MSQTNTQECTKIFSSGGGVWLATHADVPFLGGLFFTFLLSYNITYTRNAGKVPIDPMLSSSLEQGKNYMHDNPQSSTCLALSSIVDSVVKHFASLNIS